MVAVAFRRRARSRGLGAIHARNESVSQAARPTGSRCLPPSAGDVVRIRADKRHRGGVLPRNRGFVVTCKAA